MKKRAKRLCVLLAAALLVPCLFVTARADLLIEPSGDFYQAHRDECVYVYRAYLCNGPEGYVDVYRDPVSAWITDRFPNGKEIFVLQSYDLNGVLYGAIEFLDTEQENTEWKWISGWIRMEQLSLVYDAQAFYEEHIGEFIYGNVDFDYEKYDSVVFWSFPGNEEVNRYTAEQIKSWGNQLPLILKWQDGDGREWAYDGGFWICLDDPENAEIRFDARKSPPDVLIPAPETVPAPRNGQIVLAVVAVVTVAGLTLALIFVLKRRRQACPETGGRDADCGAE